MLSKHADIKILSDDQNGQGSRDGGLNVMQGLLTRFDKIDAVFAINDPTGIGASLAAKQLNRSGSSSSPRSTARRTSSRRSAPRIR